MRQISPLLLKLLKFSTLDRPVLIILGKWLKEEGNETVTNCPGLKVMGADGKFYLTEVADTDIKYD